MDITYEDIVEKLGKKDGSKLYEELSTESGLCRTTKKINMFANSVIEKAIPGSKEVTRLMFDITITKEHFTGKMTLGCSNKERKKCSRIVMLLNKMEISYV